MSRPFHLWCGDYYFHGVRFFTGLILFIYLVVAIVGFTSKNECKSRITYKDIHINRHLDMNDLLNPPDSNELFSIINKLDSINYASNAINIVKEFNYSVNRKLLIIEHIANGSKHLGALVLPKGGFRPDTTDILVLASGLNQRQPIVELGRNYWLQKMARGCEDMAILIPAFRGQALNSGLSYYCSDGFFGDAYDGAATDALRLLVVTESLYPSISKNVYVYGISRGANVAMLMASRKPDINMVIAQSGPYDFMGDFAFKRYGLQFKYQFLSRKMDTRTIREKIICSSPVYFTSKIKSEVLIIHGRKDEICSFEKAEHFYNSLPDNNSNHFKWLDGGHALDEFSYVIDQINLHRKSVKE